MYVDARFGGCAKDFAPVAGGAYEFTKVAVLVAVHVDGAILQAHLAVDGLIPAESGLLEIGVVAVVNNCHAIWSISRLGIIWGCRWGEGLGIGVGEYGEALFGAAVWHEVDVLCLIVLEGEVPLFWQSGCVAVVLQALSYLLYGDVLIYGCIAHILTRLWVAVRRGFASLNKYQSTPPHGGDGNITSPVTPPCSFQSTPPHGGRRVCMM